MRWNPIYIRRCNKWWLSSCLRIRIILIRLLLQLILFISRKSTLLLLLSLLRLLILGTRWWRFVIKLYWWLLILKGNRLLLWLLLILLLTWLLLLVYCVIGSLSFITRIWIKLHIAIILIIRIEITLWIIELFTIFKRSISDLEIESWATKWTRIFLMREIIETNRGLIILLIIPHKMLLICVRWICLLKSIVRWCYWLIII